jgi:hypothetical protein
VQEGLARHGVSEQRHKYMLPQLDVGQVAKLLTDLLREHTNQVVPDKVSSRSIRKGMTASLQYSVTEAERNIRGSQQSIEVHIVQGSECWIDNAGSQCNQQLD